MSASRDLQNTPVLPSSCCLFSLRPESLKTPATPGIGKDARGGTRAIKGIEMDDVASQGPGCVGRYRARSLGVKWGTLSGSEAADVETRQRT